MITFTEEQEAELLTAAAIAVLFVVLSAFLFDAFLLVAITYMLSH